ncbi:DNA mismatch repair endonuclease MutL [Aquimarina sp. 2201CG5-10]|uniref:DNA mismatch repair endonuclease MutL n=1 Tax=Aquimarina callyspongiae TaxID=3098150 RepID=UPI002AB3DED2|nr:DNA mismatch repair endonuclease MutL [Aquimarina sp. 2201CG5-10]MDY8137654.1 DNA mismatch repair endonuclease MutL [Aquimarina sp. 2201CG5-10]
MSDIIQLLPDHVANQIAAGEVVQRPASVVKELLENAIDAKADQIKLIIKEAGKTLIQVIDNGVGMSVTDARLSFERHATSKIKAAEDLFQIDTKGFRGEALASIAAIAHVELKTRQESDEVGTEIKIEGSEVTSQEACVTTKGTSISVKNLFYNIPARRNFLKSNAVELRHIIDEFHRVAMAHPDIRFDMYHNGSEVFNLPISNDRQRIVHIFGGKTNEKLVPIKEETDLVTIGGFVGKPEYAKRSRGEQFFFVNDRFIKSAYLNHAVNAAFEGLLKDKAHPSYFIYLKVDPKSIDINIHPTKTEIKFDDEHALYAMLRSTIKHSLGQFNVAPVLDFNRDSSMDTPYEYKSKMAQAPKIEVDRSFNPFKDEKGTVTTPSTKNYSSFKKESAGDWENLYVGLESEMATPEKSDEGFSSVQFESAEVTGSLFEGDKKTELEHNTTYQLRRKYIVTTIKSGMVIINQHRAHQRILYEELLKSITMANTVSQQLLFPIKLSFSKKEITLLETVKEQLQNTGFIFGDLSEGEVEITGIPTVATEKEISLLLEQLLSDLENEVPDSGFSQTDLLARSMAKSVAIRTGVDLDLEQQQYMVNSLFACTEPKITPDNKPTFITLTVDEIDKKF